MIIPDENVNKKKFSIVRVDKSLVNKYPKLLNYLQKFDTALYGTSSLTISELRNNIENDVVFFIFSYGNPVGFTACYFSKFYSNQALIIASLYIDKSHRQTGFGRSALTAIEDYAKKLKCKYLLIGAKNSNERALRLYYFMRFLNNFDTIYVRKQQQSVADQLSSDRERALANNNATLEYNQIQELSPTDYKQIVDLYTEYSVQISSTGYKFPKKAIEFYLRALKTSTCVYFKSNKNKILCCCMVQDVQNEMHIDMICASTKPLTIDLVKSVLSNITDDDTTWHIPVKHAAYRYIINMHGARIMHRELYKCV